MEELDLNNILEADEIEDLFSNEVIEETQPDEKQGKQEKEVTTEVNVDTLFADKPESVSGEDEDKGTEDTESDKDTSSSPKNFYSSIAKALKEEGIFPDLDDASLDSIKTPEDFAEVTEKQIQAKFDDRQKRIDEALNSGIEPDDIKKYEGTLEYLESIKEENIIDESEQGDTLRKQLIYQDFLNRGYSKERAQREVNKSITAGSDVEDAKEALSSNKEYFSTEYKTLIEEAKQEEEGRVQERKQQAEALKKSILEDKDFFGELQLDKTVRQKIYENISKPVFKNSDGELLTAVQKYQIENKTDFIKNLGLIFTLTNGFKNLDALVKGKVKKEVNKSLRELENTFNNTARNSDGNLKFVSGIDEDTESFIGKDWQIDA